MQYPKWGKLKSGLHVPTFLKQLHQDERGLWHPCGCGCQYCRYGTTPSRVQVVLAGITDDFCSLCDELLNGTFILDQYVIPGFDFPCFYFYQISDPSACTDEGGVSYDEVGFAFYETTMEVGLAINFINAHVAGWRKTISSPIDCSDIEDVELAFYTETPPAGGNKWCNVTNSTATVTAL